MRSAPFLVAMILLAGGSALADEPGAESPIRERRPVALTAEAGWNGLAGVGVNLSYHATPHLSIDAGGGLSALGLKGGLRVRGNLLTSSLTPYAGLGLLCGTGSLGGEVENVSEGNAVRFKLDPSPFLQLVLGLDLVLDGGFTLNANLGYAVLLRSNLHLVSGTPTSVQNKAFDLAYGSGPVLAASLGYSFGG